MNLPECRGQFCKLAVPQTNRRDKLSELVSNENLHLFVVGFTISTKIPKEPTQPTESKDVASLTGVKHHKNIISKN